MIKSFLGSRNRDSESLEKTEVDTPLNKNFYLENYERSILHIKETRLYFDYSLPRENSPKNASNQFSKFSLDGDSERLDDQTGQASNSVNFQIPSENNIVPFSEVYQPQTSILKSTKPKLSLDETVFKDINDKDLPLPKSRKWGRDSFHKKIKCMFLKFVVSYFQTRLGLTFVQKLSQALVTNVTKRFNRLFLEMDLYSFGIKYLGLTYNSYESSTTRPLDKSMKISSLFEEYLDSVNFEMDLRKIREKEDEYYVGTLLKYIKDFVSYFTEIKQSKN